MKIVTFVLAMSALHMYGADSKLKKLAHYASHISGTWCGVLKKPKIDVTPAQLLEVDVRKEEETDSFADAPVAEKHLNTKSLNNED